MEKITKTVQLDFITEIKKSNIDSLKTLITSFENFATSAPSQEFKVLNSSLEVMRNTLKAISDADSLSEVNKIIKITAREIKKAEKEAKSYYETTKKGAEQATEEVKKLYDEQKKYDTLIKDSEQRIKKLEKSKKNLQTGGDLRQYAVKELGVGSNNKVFSRVSEDYDIMELEKFVKLTKERINLLSKEPEKETKKDKAAREKDISVLEKIIKGIEKQNTEQRDLTLEIDKQNKALIQQKKLRDDINSQINIAESSPENSELTDSMNKLNSAVTQQEEIAKGTESAKALQDVDKVTESLGNQKVEVENLTKSMITSTLAVNLLKQAYRQTISTITELDAAFNGIAIVSQYSTKQVWGMYNAFEGIALRSGLTVKSISQVALEFFRQGRSLTDSLRLTEAAATAAQIAGINAAESVRYLTSAIQGYKLSADQAMVVSDKFAALAAASATDYDGLATALSKVAAQANAVGVNMDSMMGFIAKALETTQEAPENIGTAFKTIFARMSEIKDFGATLEDGMSINKIEKALKTANVALRGQGGEIRNLDKILFEVGGKWTTLTRNQQTYITTALAGTRQQTRLLSIFQDFDRTMELVNVSASSLGATYAQQSVYTESLAFAMNNLNVAWEGFVSSVSNSNVFISVVGFLTNMIVGMENFNSLLGGIPGMIVLVVVAIIALTSAFERLSRASIKAGEYIQKVGTDGMIASIGIKAAGKASTATGTKMRIMAKGTELAAGGFTKATTALGTFLTTATGGTFAIIIAVISAVLLLASNLKTVRERLSESNEEAKKLQASLYKLREKDTSFQALIEEFEVLSNKITKTTEDLARLEELRMKMNDYGKDDEGNQEYNFFGLDGKLRTEELDRYLADMRTKTKEAYEQMRKDSIKFLKDTKGDYELMKDNFASLEGLTEINAMDLAFSQGELGESTSEMIENWQELNVEAKEFYKSLSMQVIKEQKSLDILLAKNAAEKEVKRFTFDVGKARHDALQSTSAYKTEYTKEMYEKELAILQEDVSKATNLSVEKAEKEMQDYINKILEIKEKLSGNLSEDFKLVTELDIKTPETFATLLESVDATLSSVYRMKDEIASIDSGWTSDALSGIYDGFIKVGLEADQAAENVKKVINMKPEYAIPILLRDVSANFDTLSQAIHFADIQAEGLFGTDATKSLLEYAKTLKSAGNSLQEVLSSLTGGEADYNRLLEIANEFPEVWKYANEILARGGEVTDEMAKNYEKDLELGLAVAKEKAVADVLYRRQKLILQKEGIVALLKLSDSELKAYFTNNETQLQVDADTWQNRVMIAGKAGAKISEIVQKAQAGTLVESDYANELGLENFITLENRAKESIESIRKQLETQNLELDRQIASIEEEYQFIMNIEHHANSLFSNAAKSSKGAAAAANDYKAKLLEIYAIEQQLAYIDSIKAGYDDDRALALAKVIGLANEELEIKRINNKYDLQKLMFDKKQLQLQIQMANLQKSNQNTIIEQLSKFGDVVDTSTGRAIINFSKLSQYTGDTREEIENLIEEFNSLADSINSTISAARRQQAEILTMINTLKKRNKEILELIEDLAGKQTLEAIKNLEDLVLEAIKDREQAKIDILKDALEEERKLLEERKKLYDEAFAEMDHEEEMSSIDSQRSSLVAQIAQLSTATDSASAKKREELQKELDALNKDYNSKLQDYNRENLFKDDEAALEEKEQEIQDLEDRLGNMSNFYDEMNAIIAAGDDAIKEFLKNNLAEYADATLTNKELIEISWQETLDKRKEIADEIKELQDEYINNIETLGKMEIEYDNLKEELAQLEYLRNQAIAQSQEYLAKSTKNTMNDMANAVVNAANRMTSAVQSLINTIHAIPDVPEITIPTGRPGGGGGSASWMPYATGGSTQRTGWHWLDGSRGAPERVLSKTQTKLLDNMLMELGNRAFGDSNNSVVVDSITIQTNELNNDLDFKRAGNILAEELQQAMLNRGITLDKRK